MNIYFVQFSEIRTQNFHQQFITAAGEDEVREALRATFGDRIHVNQVSIKEVGTAGPASRATFHANSEEEVEAYSKVWAVKYALDSFANQMRSWRKHSDPLPDFSQVDETFCELLGEHLL